jgi:integrase
MVRVTPANNNGSIRIRFRFLGNSYTVPICGKYHNRLDRAKAEVICAQIELDVESGRFDDTLERYSSADPKQRPNPPRLLKVWDLWVESLDLSEQVKVGHYRDLRAMILRSTPDPLSNDVQWFNQATGHLAASTHNLRLGMLKACTKWAIGEKLVKTNPYTKIKRKKPDRQSVKPLSLEEMATILEGFETRSPSYVPYVAFLFMTGVRNSEASGLQWKRIDWARGEVTIADSLSTVRYSKSKVRKTTKTGAVTVLKMNNRRCATFLGVTDQPVKL